MAEKRKSSDDHAPWKPPKWEIHHAAAIQALVDGVAEPEQQKLALHWIIEECCRTYDLSFRPGGSDGERETAFAEGRRSVGLNLVMLTRVNISKLRRKDTENA